MLSKILHKIGIRNIKITIAVTLSAVIMHYVFHQNPFFSSIGATIGVSKTRKTSKEAIITKNIGMIIGGIIGMLLSSITNNVVIQGLGVLPVIIGIDLSGRKESKLSGCIMYYGIMFLNNFDTAGNYAIRSITQTLFGSLVGILITRKEVNDKEEENLDLSK